MEKQNNLKEELLKQMDQNRGAPPNGDQNSIQRSFLYKAFQERLKKARGAILFRDSR